MGSVVETIVSVAGKDKQEMMAYLEEVWSPSISIFETLSMVIDKLGLKVENADIVIFTKEGVEHI